MRFKLSPRAALVIIAALFVVPLVLAWLMYSGTIQYQPGSTRNLGELVRPAVPVDWSLAVPVPGGENSPVRPPPEQAFERHWVILHAIEAPCGERCLETVTGLRQVHRASGRQQGRIRLALMLPEGSPESVAAELGSLYGPFRLLTDPGGEIRRAMDTAAARSAPDPDLAGSTYLVDPLGHIMMYYAAGSDPNHLKKDLKRLLTWSKLDETS